MNFTTHARRRGSLKGGVFLALFSLPFAAVGVGMTVWLWRDVMLSREIKTRWRPVPAMVREVELERHRGSKGGTTYETTATYAYTFEGRTYESSRLGLSGGADNIGDYQQKLYAELRRAQQARHPVECRVNPADPAEVVLRADWRPEMGLFHALFGLVFGAVGLGMFAGCVAGAVGGLRTSPLKRRHPQEPWLWRSEWQSPVLLAPLGRKLVVATAVLAWVHIVTAPLWSVLPASWAAGGAFKWLLSGMLLLVLVVSGFCVRTILHARKYRGARLEFDMLPLRPGAVCNARLYLPQTISLGSTLELALVCSHSVTTGSGKRRTTNTTQVWTHGETVAGLIGPQQAIPFSCRLPESAPVTAFDNPNDVHTWTFEASADVPGVDLNLKFELPVFATGTRVTS